LKSFSYRLIIEELPLHLLLENFFTALLLKSFLYRFIIEELLLPPYYWRAFYTAFVNL
jgi:hypothetical protein